MASNDWKVPVNRLSEIIKKWGQQSLGSMLRDGWRAQFPKPPGPKYPWSDEDQEAVNQPDAIRVCHHCLTPQEHMGWFCPECGAATGPYNNCMPFVNIFSAGEVLRAGVDGKIRFRKWVYPVYFLIGLFEYLIFAPLYWFRLFRAKKRRVQNLASSAESVGEFWLGQPSHCME